LDKWGICKPGCPRALRNRPDRPSCGPAPQGEFKVQRGAGPWHPTSAQLLLERGYVVLPSTLRFRVKAGGGNGRASGWQTWRLGQVGKDDAAAAAGAGEHVVPEDAPEQVCPGDGRCAPKPVGARAAIVS
jgi:hypothetical protein